MAKRNSKGRFVKSRKSNPRRHKRRASNPRRHKRRASNPRRHKRRASNPRRHYRRHRNPRMSMSGITSQLMPAAYGAAGAIALDVILGYVPMPAMLSTGYAKSATKIVGALGLGYLAKRFLRGKGSAVAAGALTVAVYGLMKQVIVQFAPSVKGLGDYEEIAIDNTADQIGTYMDPAARIGAYLPDGSIAPGVGAYINGPVDDFYDRDGANLSGMDY
jgi:hypothetical protein